MFMLARDMIPMRTFNRRLTRIIKYLPHLKNLAWNIYRGFQDEHPKGLGQTQTSVHKHCRTHKTVLRQRDGFAASNRKLGVEFDAIYTAEDIGSYKPAAANFEYLLARLDADLGLARSDILHTAQSLFHDHVSANKFGLANAWIDRRRLSESGAWGATAKVEQRPDIDFMFFSMAEMAEAVRKESG